ncbi:CDGSH iron-sulfur domain-containing protein [Thalassoglobus sp. JC818]|uniref:CDGSH iron-sulfur domain-containing protein n=1 Tax=Thalassoglobus sp. JC818 TaxID=3232136 RepID=UPI0034573BE0
MSDQFEPSELPKPAGLAPAKVSLEAGKNYAYCTCGLSSNQPFCDGAHKGTGFAPHKFTAEEDCSMMMCMCKKTGNTPRCDGTHKSLPQDA